MKNYYITFGQVHTHAVQDQWIDKDCVVEIESPDYETGRARAFELFGQKFCFFKEEKPDMSYFPRGIIKLT